LSGRWDEIFAVEKDPATLACAKHNARIYGVEEKIWWIQGDIFQVSKKRLNGVVENAVIFGSPPWGGKCRSRPMV
jgi:trimethylguanosine synthase